MTHMGESVGIRALQQNASAVVARAKAGEIVEITERGRPVARLVPLSQGSIEDKIRAGLIRPATKRFSDFPPPLPLEPGKPTPSEILAEMRAGERY